MRNRRAMDRETTKDNKRFSLRNSQPFISKRVGGDKKRGSQVSK